MMSITHTHIAGSSAGRSWTLRFMLGIALLLLVASGARSQETYSARDSLATLLNEKFTILRTAGLLESHTITMTMRLADPATGCEESGTAVTITLTRIDSNNASMQIKLRDPDSIDIPPGSHDMVCDLEEVWLRRSWGLVIRDSIGSHGIGDPTCLASGLISQQYFMGGVVNVLGQQRVLDTLKVRGVADWDLQGKTYMVKDGPTLGDSARTGLLEFPRTDADSDDVSYLGKEAIGPTRDTGIAKLAYTKVMFHPRFEVLSAGGERVIAVEIEAHAKTNTPTECSPTTTGLLQPESTPRVRVSYLVYKSSTNDSTWYHCEKTFSTSAELWAYFDRDEQYHVDGWCMFDIDTAGVLYFEVFDAGECGTTGRYPIMQLRSRAIPAQYCEAVYDLYTLFSVDSITGAMMASFDDEMEEVVCLPFCKQLAGYRTIDGVIAASAVQLDSTWPYDPPDYLRPSELNTWGLENTSNNRYETGMERWRPRATYAYRTGIVGAGKLSSIAERTYADAGVFLNSTGTTTGGFRMFNWLNPEANDGTGWLNPSTVTLFSPFGEPLEERDILGIYSAAKFAHENTVPKLVAKNAQYNAVGFESFEDGRGNASNYAHSGKKSYKLPMSGFTSDTIIRLVTTQQMIDKGVLVRVWAKRTYRDDDTNEIAIDCNGLGGDAFTKVAQTGEWTLYEKVHALEEPYDTVGAVFGLKFKIGLSQPGDANNHDSVWIDDVRAQPFDAEMICYVYDASNLRLLTQFDDQHFGAYYQYNGEGKLTRTLRETERGMKTVAERQYHTPQWQYRNGTTPSGTQSSGGGAAMAFRNEGAMPPGLSAGVAEKADGGRIDLLDLSLGLDGPKGSVMGGRSVDLSRLDASLLDSLAASLLSRAKPEELAVLKGLGLEEIERARLLVEAYEIDKQLQALEAEEELRRPEPAQTRAEVIRALRERREKVVREKLGLSEEELRAAYAVAGSQLKQDSNDER